MSSTKRRKAQKDKRIRIILTSIILAGAMAVFIWGIFDIYDYGISARCLLFGVPIIILFYCAGNIISPVLKEWNEKGRLARAKLNKT